MMASPPLLWLPQAPRRRVEVGKVAAVAGDEVVGGGCVRGGGGGGEAEGQNSGEGLGGGEHCASISEDWWMSVGVRMMDGI